MIIVTLRTICYFIIFFYIQFASKTKKQQMNSYSRYYPQSPNRCQPVTNKPKGLPNLTNTCYISAILQILFLIIPDTINNSNIVTDIFFQLKHYRTVENYKLFKRILEAEIKMMRGYAQQDAQEFLINFLEILNRQNTRKVSNLKTLKLVYNEEEEPIMTSYNNFMRETLKTENSIITDLFSAELVHKFICPNKHTKYKFQRYQYLPVNFPTRSTFSIFQSCTCFFEQIHLQQLINNALNVENISGLICDQCNKKTTFTKETFLFTTPRYLFFHLVRFKVGSFTNKKIKTGVQVPQFLEIHEERVQGKVNYRLRGTVNHEGSLDQGHYFAQVKWLDGLWYEINDYHVRPCESPFISPSKSIYILCYEKI